MALGKGSLRSLASIIHPLKGQLAQWRDGDRKLHVDLHARRPRQYAAQGENPPAPRPPRLAVAALRGEAVLRSYFFGTQPGHFLARLPITPSDMQLLEYWHFWVENRGHIADLVRRLGLVAEIATATTVPAQQDNDWCYTLYLAFLDHLQQQSAHHALEQATTRFFLHLWRQRFPETAKAQTLIKRAKSTNAQALTEKVLIVLRKQGYPHARNKESFKEVANSGIRFVLMLQPKPQTPWQEYVVVEHPHLDAARYMAYAAAKAKLSAAAKDDLTLL